ncbi:hypothetical protein G4B88_001900 [Cannabis sativa]|uniref:Uncharacterized protein n=1 Tax=Cannabis sativa TaxID=3483 RepID=A0A7J6HCU4_CANSA|nr:hypothetical protein G4B88_001900 [Cannabis sativa]
MVTALTLESQDLSSEIQRLASHSFFLMYVCANQHAIVSTDSTLIDALASSRLLKQQYLDKCVIQLNSIQSLIWKVHGLLGDWNKGPHLTGYVDFAECIKDHHPRHGESFPWTSWSNCLKPNLSECRTKLEDLDEKVKSLSIEEASYYREAVVVLRLAKEVIKVQQDWRANAIAHLN